jgi:hypothetical protein
MEHHGRRACRPHRDYREGERLGKAEPRRFVECGRGSIRGSTPKYPRVQLHVERIAAVANMETPGSSHSAGRLRRNS